MVCLGVGVLGSELVRGMILQKAARLWAGQVDFRSDKSDVGHSGLFHPNTCFAYYA